MTKAHSNLIITGDIKTRTLALDVGDKRIGVAVSDPEGILASPFTIIAYEVETEAIERVVRIIQEQQIGRVIVGLPRSLDGTLGEQAVKVQAFTQNLIAGTSVPVEFRDERLTTVMAQRLIQSANTKKNRKKGKVEDDAVAAAVILQDYLGESRVISYESPDDL